MTLRITCCSHPAVLSHSVAEQTKVDYMEENNLHSKTPTGYLSPRFSSTYYILHKYSIYFKLQTPMVNPECSLEDLKVGEVGVSFPPFIWEKVEFVQQ